jgi:nucleoid-associated protein Lsr2
MVQKVLVQLVDDLDGKTGEDVSTVEFGLDGVSYEIDLTEANAERLRDSLADYLNSARRVGGRVRRSTNSRTGQPAVNGQASQIREWASSNGFEVSSRGRMSAHIVEAYHEAHTKPPKPSKPERLARSGTKRARVTKR